MPTIKNSAYLIPRGTSQLVITPAYEKPLLQLKYNSGQADRDKWIKELSKFPEGLPPSAECEQREAEQEMERLAATYGVEAFRKVYPIDDLFIRAFDSCQTVTLTSQQGAVPDMDKAPPMLIDEFMALNVPGMDRTKAEKLVAANLTVDLMPMAELRSVASLTGLSNNLIRATIEAARTRPQQPVVRNVPSAPAELRVTSMEAAGIK